jgi:hypothetical protein
MEKEDEWYFYQGTTGDFRWTIHGDGTNFVSSGALATDQWHHLVGTYDGSTYRIYVNGELKDSRSYGTGMSNSVYPLTLGARRSAGGAPTSFYNGVVDEVRIWNIARTAGEIRGSMNSTLTGFEQNLVAYLQLNEGSGTTAGNFVSENGSLVNSPTWLSSTIPAGGGSSGSVSGFTAGNVTLGDVSMATDDGFDNAVDLTATTINAVPNVLPGLFLTVAGDAYFVVNVFGSPGTFAVSLSLNYGPGILDPLVDLYPAGVKLYRRDSNSEGEWTFVASADSARSSTGMAYFSGITSFSQFTVVEDEALLPVQMSSFTATQSRVGAELAWRTETEVGNHGFEVERRTVSGSTAKLTDPEIFNLNPETAWMTVGFVEGSGTSSSPKAYSFVDKVLAPGRYAYRLKQIDHSGSFSYTASVEVEVGLAPMEFNLGQNYPNPFNPSTTIEFTLPEDARAVLKIYDLQGREVATLVDEDRKAGVYHQVVFDASRLASGLYFYRLQAGSLQTIKKMLLIK